MREKTTLEFIELLNDQELKQLVTDSINQAKLINPDKDTNPVQSLDELYDFLDWSVKCLPWNVIKDHKHSTLYSNVNQSINYLWFIFGQQIDKLKNKGYYLPTLEYHEPIASWIKEYSKTWGNFLNTKESWNDNYFKLQFSDNSFGMNNGWFSKENIWTTYNEFFSRKLIDPSVRPIGKSEFVSPADSTPAGYWSIDCSGYVNDEIQIKNHKVYNINNILGKNSKFKNYFNGGTITHTFLDVNDYHRYHFPIDGKVVELTKISDFNGVGGEIFFDKNTKEYKLNSNDTSWQIIETRDVIILETKFGYIAIIPVGMSQVCSCNFEDNVQIGKEFKKGDPLGYFLFGGSDIVMLFQKNIIFNPLFNKDKHILMGEDYANLNIK